MELKILDLFCGAGGWSEGLTQAGHEVIGAVDFWDKAIDTYNLNFPDHNAKLMNVLSLSPDDDIIAEADLIVGSPPCQGFSMQNNKRTNDLALTKHFLNLVKKKPFIMENVTTVKKVLDKTGLTQGMNSKNVSMWDYGVPQPRNRFILSNFFNIDDVPKVHNGLENFYPLFDLIPEENLKRDKVNHAPHIVERISKIKNGGFWKRQDVYHRLALTGKSLTITNVTKAITLHPFIDRRITVFEGAIIQTFPPTYKFAGYKTNISQQVANAVPPAFSYNIGKALYDQPPIV